MGRRAQKAFQSWEKGQIEYKALLTGVTFRGDKRLKKRLVSIDAQQIHSFFKRLRGSIEKKENELNYFDRERIAEALDSIASTIIYSMQYLEAWTIFSPAAMRKRAAIFTLSRKILERIKTLADESKQIEGEKWDGKVKEFEEWMLEANYYLATIEPKDALQIDSFEKLIDPAKIRTSVFGKESLTLQGIERLFNESPWNRYDAWYQRIKQHTHDKRFFKPSIVQFRSAYIQAFLNKPLRQMFPSHSPLGDNRISAKHLLLGIFRVYASSLFELQNNLLLPRRIEIFRTGLQKVVEQTAIFLKKREYSEEYVSKPPEKRLKELHRFLRYAEATVLKQA